MNGAPGPAPAEMPADARAGEALGAALLTVLPGPERTPVFSPASIAAARASLHEANVTAAAEQARQEINAAIGRQTAGKITGLLPPGSVGPLGPCEQALAAVPVRLTFDRPFLFAITHAAAGLPLFPGRVTDPRG